MKLNPEKIALAIVLRITKDGTYGHIVGSIETPSHDEERGSIHLPYGHPLEKIVLHSQASEGNDKVYGYEVCAIDGYRDDQYRLEQKLAILKPINRALEKSRRELGYPLSYGQWICRVAAAIGARTIIIARMEPVRNGTEWARGNPGDMVSQIDRTAAELVTWCNRNVKAAA